MVSEKKLKIAPFSLTLLRASSQTRRLSFVRSWLSTRKLHSWSGSRCFIAR